MARLGDICEILNGYAFKSEKYISSGIRVIRIANVQKGYIEDTAPAFYPIDTPDIEKYTLYEDDLLISLTGNVGRVALLKKEFLPAALNQRVACLRLKEGVPYNKSFLYCFLNSDYFENKCIQSAKGVAQKNMSTEWLKDYEIPDLSLEEQREIATALNKVSELITARTQQLSTFDNIVKSRFIELFGDPISNPKGLPVKTLKQLSTLITNGNTPKGGSENYVDDGILFIRSQNVWRNRIELDDVAYIDEETHRSLKKSSLKHKDILITKTGRINTENSSLGRAALFLGKDDSANINGHVYLVRLDGSVVPEYVISILTSEAYRKYIRKVCVGGIDKRQINLDQVEEFPIILPSVKQQNEFATFVEHTDKLKFDNLSWLVKVRRFLYNYRCLGVCL